MLLCSTSRGRGRVWANCTPLKSIGDSQYPWVMGQGLPVVEYGEEQRCGLVGGGERRSAPHAPWKCREGAEQRRPCRRSGCGRTRTIGRSRSMRHTCGGWSAPDGNIIAHEIGHTLLMDGEVRRDRAGWQFCVQYDCQHHRKGAEAGPRRVATAEGDMDGKRYGVGAWGQPPDHGLQLWQRLCHYF